MAKNYEKLAAKEQKELTRRLAQREKKPYAGYFGFLCIIIVLVHIADEITTNIGTYVQSSVVTEFIANPYNMEYSDALGTFTTVSAAFMIFSILAPFYKSLADVFGRKTFLCINTLGLAVGLLLCWLSSNIVVYLLGAAVCTFFIQHDMQVIYIYEVAPANKRATIYGVTKAIGTVGLVLVPLMRDWFMGDDASKWREVYFIPVFVAVAAALLAFIFTRESGVFVDSRIKYLETPIAEREAQKAEKKKEEKANKAGVFRALGYIFRNKQLRWLAIAYFVYFMATIAISQQVESIMFDFNMSTADITKALFVYPFVFAAIIFVSGFIGDKAGRKVVAGICGVAALVGFAAFNVLAMIGANPYLIGLCYAIFLGGYWTTGDYMNMMAVEKTPTEIRGSVVGALGLLVIVASMLGMIFVTIGNFILSTVGYACLIAAIPPVAIGVLILLFKVKETKGADLEKAGHEDEQPVAVAEDKAE